MAEKGSTAPVKLRPPKWSTPSSYSYTSPWRRTAEVPIQESASRSGEVVHFNSRRTLQPLVDFKDYERAMALQKRRT